MINILWLFLIVAGFLIAALTGQMDKVTEGIFQGAFRSVELMIKLIGPMAIWSGVMKIAKESDLIGLIGKKIRPIFKLVFPSIPDNHPASGAILMNLSANLLGLGNSATPLGIQAMNELQDLNKNHSTASLAMCTLLALNTSSLTIIPSTIISLRAASGSNYPAIIVLSTLFATSVSTITALFLDKVFRLFSNE
ncbi:MAG TPA: nucleoside recognition domain-containing protein [Halanaerobiales bacterium]|nr:nucleoside recognition domain-containing protein [Halanaerobiales bacterium]